MRETAHLITINITNDETGLFTATSRDEPGFFLCLAGLDRLLDAVPLALENFYRSKNENIAAIPAGSGDVAASAWAIVPKRLLQQAAERSVAVPAL